ncbi:alpha/beta fold hydrolase [Brachybacterium sp. ACRRE]|uniref:alpha/beta fold hydrolase n=1 Tax=Brachybacterium sp. ACRRE TaxID=2918184 RepID=UPI001EF17131|nr:alpha/beta hydrolase [Brachybacterium sp. ACRRE]MCG7309560.1 alpha/beta hydrolase [Brachybacterium sp. ACRRE]
METKTHPLALPAPAMVDLDGIRTATWLLESAVGGPTGRTSVRPTGRDVVLCHGTPWSARVWAHVAATLAADRRVLLWDMPGYGRSEMGPQVPVDLATQMGRLPRLLDVLGIERPHVVAHDIGGAVALGAHLLHGQDLASLMLWDPVVLEPWGSPFFRLVAENADVFAALPPQLHRALVREYISGAAGAPLDARVLEQLVDPWTTPEGRSGFYRQIAALTPAHTRPIARSLGSVRCPVAIGWGEEDPWIPVEQAARLSAALPGRPTPRLLPGVGHLAPLEASRAVGDTVRQWLARLESSAGPDVCVQPRG